MAKINTVRLFKDKKYDYRFIIRNNLTGEKLWDYPLMDILVHMKPANRPDGTELPMQEFLDRQSEWNIILLYKEVPGGSEGFLAIGIVLQDWILWINDIGV